MRELDRWLCTPRYTDGDLVVMAAIFLMGLGAGIALALGVWG